MKRIILLSLGLALWLPNAEAAIIRNIDKVPYVLKVTDGGEEKEVMLAPGSSYRTAGPHVVTELKGQKPIRTIGDSELMIKHGKLSLQRRDSRSIR